MGFLKINNSGLFWQYPGSTGLHPLPGAVAAAVRNDTDLTRGRRNPDHAREALAEVHPPAVHADDSRYGRLNSRSHRRPAPSTQLRHDPARHDAMASRSVVTPWGLRPRGQEIGNGDPAFPLALDDGLGDTVARRPSSLTIPRATPPRLRPLPWPTRPRGISYSPANVCVNGKGNGTSTTHTLLTVGGDLEARAFSGSRGRSHSRCRMRPWHPPSGPGPPMQDQIELAFAPRGAGPLAA